MSAVSLIGLTKPVINSLSEPRSVSSRSVLVHIKGAELTPLDQLCTMEKPARATYFTTEEQTIILRMYEKYREIIQAKRNTAAAARSRKESWQNIADSVNAPAADCKYDADGLESFINSSSIRVEYYRSLEYCVKWKLAMYPRRSSRPPKASKRSPQRSPSPSEDIIQRNWRTKRRRTGLRETEADGDVVDADETKDRDIIDIINSTCVAEEEEEVHFVEVTDDGVDDSDDDCVSVTSSIASGPSVPHNGVSPKKLRPSQGLCLACKALYQKARKMKAPIKNKLLDNDPKSLTCDQWVLIKTWRPRRLPNARGKLLIRVQLFLKRLAAKSGAKRPAQCVGEPSACSRPHAFLQRNLRRHVRVPVKKERKKKNRKKWTRGGSRGRSVAKQQQQQQQRRLHSSIHGQRISVSLTSPPGFEGRSDQADTNLALKLIPSTVAVETTKPREVPPEKKAPKKTSGLRDLLAQLRGSSSMIVRETR